MNKSDTQILTFKDNNKSVFTLKQGKSYNMTKTTTKGSMFEKKKYCFVIYNCVSADSFTVEYSDPTTRDNDYAGFVKTYLKFNDME